MGANRTTHSHAIVRSGTFARKFSQREYSEDWAKQPLLRAKAKIPNKKPRTG